MIHCSNGPFSAVQSPARHSYGFSSEEEIASFSESVTLKHLTNIIPKVRQPSCLICLCRIPLEAQLARSLVPLPLRGPQGKEI